MITIKKGLMAPPVTFSPHFYKTAYQKFINGDLKQLIALMKKATTDSTVAGCLVGRRAGFQRDFVIRPFDPDSNSDQVNTTWLRNMIDGLDPRGLFKAIHDALLYKYSVIDFEWEIVNGKETIIQYKKFDQHFFKYVEGQLVIDKGRGFEEIPPTALVCETPDDLPVMLPVLRDYILKDFGLEAWASFIETFGEAIIIGKYPPGVNNDVKTELETAVQSIGSSSRGTMPNTAEIDVVESRRSTGDHASFTSAADQGIAISILGHENAVAQASGLQVGENLSAFKVRMDIAIDDMHFIDASMNRLVRIIWDRNIGDGRYPVFSLDKTGPINVGERLDILNQYYEQGGRINPDEYRQLGIQVYDDQDPLEQITTPFGGE